MQLNLSHPLTTSSPTFWHVSRCKDQLRTSMIASSRALTLSTLSLLIFSSFLGCSSSRAKEQREAQMLLNQLEAQSNASPLSPSMPVTTTPPQWKERPEQEIAPGFSLRLESSSDRIVNGLFQVNDTGTVSLPYNTILKASGLLVSEFQNEVRNAYKTYLVNPDIVVSIAKREYYVNVKGLVEKPGPVLVEPNSSLDEIIGKAGGVASSSKQGNAPQFVKIDQLGVSAHINLNDYYRGATTAIPKWQGGETIFLQSEGARVPKGTQATGPQFVKIIGEVRSPGSYPYSEDSDFFTYLIGAGGPTSQADLTNVQIVRNGTNGREMIQFKGTAKGSIPPVKQGDTIIMNASNPDSFRSNLQVYGTLAGILGALAAIFAVAL